MKILVIGDLHGRDCWKDVIDREGINKVIFIGDYCDSFDYSDIEILHNLNKIINYKLENPNKVELLIGNHELHYIYYPNYKCSGFRPTMMHDLGHLLNKNINLFKIAYKHDNYLFTHAGVTKKWLNKNINMLKGYGLNEDLNNIDEALNNINETSNRWILNTYNEKRGGMRYDLGGPTWADKSETWFDAVPNFIQVVGHTPVGGLHTNEAKQTEGEGLVYYVDCLDKYKKENMYDYFLILDI